VPTISSNGQVGLLCRAITTDSAPGFGLESAKGMEVIGITSGSSAEAAGIRMHDIIVSIGGVPVRDLSGLPKLARSAPVVPVELQRDRKRQVVQLALDKLRH
jgi:serine protease Do